jgi:Ser/Thr protein kinase RdoA (MazF antagonist)
MAERAPLSLAAASRAAAAFVRGSCRLRPLGAGNINDTFLIEGAGDPLVLQRISAAVFPRPELVVHNFALVSEHLQRRSAAEQLPIEVARPVVTLAGQLFHRDEAGGYWRVQSYLPHSPRRQLTAPRQARRVGLTLATFHYLLADLPLHQQSALRDPLPGFHHLPGYLDEYRRAIAAWTGDPGSEEEECLTAITRYIPHCRALQAAQESGLLPRQAVHGDPKIDNFLFTCAGDPVGLIDLDTVGGGLVVTDLGDCLRSGCNRAGEGGGAAPVEFDLDLAGELIAGYLQGPGGPPPAALRAAIFDGLLLVCFELGLRFFTDYLRGNSYFKVTSPRDNLHRALSQFRLSDVIAAQESAIRRLTG